MKTLTPFDERMSEFRKQVRDRIDESRRRIAHRVRVTRAILKATRTLLVGVGLVDESKDVPWLPFQAFWVVWWLLVAVGLVLPTYGAEPFVVFPSVLALSVVWLLGMAQYAHALLTTDMRDIKLTPEAWTVLVTSFRDEGVEVPKELLTPESAQEASRSLEGWLPGMARRSVLQLTTLAALQALLAGAVAVVGLLIGPTLSSIHWWHGWSPVAVLYAASLPSGLSLVFYGFVPFITARFLAALRLHSETTAPKNAEAEQAAAAAAPPATASNMSSKPRRRTSKNPNAP